MLFYPKTLARDLIFPINKKHITSLYQLALEDLSITHTTRQAWRHNPLKLSLIDTILNDNKLYGNITGIHLRSVNGKYFEIKLPILITTDDGYQRYQKFPSFPPPIPQALFHKGKHVSKNIELLMEFTGFGFPFPNSIPTVTVKRMCIKLGSIKTRVLTFHNFFRFEN